MIGTDHQYAFLVVHGRATLRFDAPVAEANEIVRDLKERLHAHAGSANDEAEARNGIREVIRTDLLDNAHLDPVKSQRLSQMVIYFCLTSAKRMEAEMLGLRGYVLEITEKGGNDFNFRVAMVPGKADVDAMCAKVRRNQKYVVSVSQEEARRAAEAAKRRKKTPLPRDPSLEPPPRPRPDRFLPILETIERWLGADQLADARACLERGACFVFRSHQIATESQEEIDASLAAMAEYDRLHLPYPEIWVETRDHVEIFGDGGPVKVEALIGIAACERDGVIRFQGFAEYNGQRHMSAVRGTVDKGTFLEGRRVIPLEAPRVPAHIVYDESQGRRLTAHAGELLLELLFLLATAGVDKEKKRGADDHDPRRRARDKRRRDKRSAPPRDYTVIRVPLAYDADAEGGAGGKGRWKRPHVRRAHMWGKNTRLPEEQRWVEATLVGAARLSADEAVRRPEYRVG